tara:strand:- start:1139 stop:1738 length:600 start_codon:yes stop_codon:yes gene_type:complete
MINIKKISNKAPYFRFTELYNDALKANQKIIEAVCISSYNSINDEVESRFVNLKYISNEDWIFFTNYDSPKAIQFKEHNQITALFFWNSTNVQIRIKALISKTSEEFSNLHYLARSKEKNALAHSSDQSSPIDSYDDVVQNYEIAMNNKDLISSRPDNWGGFAFKPYYFEFWEGNKYRLNKREVHQKINEDWIKSFIQP